MKKSIFYIPSIILTVFYVVLVISKESILPIGLVWLALFFISGFILNKNIFWGCLFGTLPAIHIIYIGTQDEGQIINQIPIGIVIFIFYIICGCYVYVNNKKVEIAS